MMHNDNFRLITEDMERLKEEVMSRVKTVRRVRAFFASPLSSMMLMIAFMLCASIFVSFGDVVKNIMLQAEWGGRFSYAYDSVMHTRITVQVLALLTSVSSLALLFKLMLRLRIPVYFIGNFIYSRSPLKFFKS